MPLPPSDGFFSASADDAADGADLEVVVVSDPPRRLRVLLVEDDADHAALTEAYLAGVRDPEVDLTHHETVEDAAQALLQAREAQQPFHAVLSDQQLPDSDYWETVGRMVEAAGTAPVIALTSLGDMDVALDAMRAGASDYLVKSELTPELLRRTLRYAVERATRDEALRMSNAALRQTLRHVRQMQSQVVEQEKLAGLGRLLSGVAHELRNPLGLTVNAAESIALEAESLAQALPDLSGDAADHLDTLRDFAQRAARNGRRADGVVRSLYEHARGVEGDVWHVDLDDIVGAALAQADTEGVDVSLDLHHHLLVIGSGSALARMLGNLIENAALAARSGGGHVWIRTAPAEGSAGPSARITVEDDGPGLEASISETAFEPFVSGWPEGRRIGLGLTFARAIILGHRGQITLSASPAGGIRVDALLPTAPLPAEED